MNQGVADAISRELTADELRDYVNQPVTPAEREGLRDLVRWFTTRYPTPLERLTYVRRASARWSRASRPRRD